jgi:hypothetical protein
MSGETTNQSIPKSLHTEADFFCLQLTEQPRKKRKYENKTGLTDQQRLLLHNLTQSKGNFLQEVTRHNGRKMFRCYDRKKNMVLIKDRSPDFSKVVVQNLVSKGILIQSKEKFFLK